MTTEIGLKITCDISEAAEKLKEMIALLERIKVLQQEIGKCSCEK